jgi:hypothetical protein
MRRLIYIFILLIVEVFLSLSLTKPGKISVPVEKGAILFHSKYLFSDSNKVASFECNDFVSVALNNYTIELLSRKFSGFLNCTKEPVINMHNAEVIDTIYTFSNPENEIQIYRSGQTDFISNFDVSDSRFNLTGNIKPGMSKESFSSKFQIKDTLVHEVEIINSEGTAKFLFYFHNNRLIRISCELYLD